MNLSTLRAAVTADWGPTIRAMAYHVAAAAAFTYVAGMALGTWIHRTNDQMLALLPHRQHHVIPVPPVTTPPMLPFCSILLSELDAMTCRELRQLAGINSKKYRKHELLARVAYMPI